jgi:hypothetical protein
MATSDTTAPEPIAAAKKLALARRGTPGRSRRLAIVQPFVSFRTQRLIASMHAIVRMTLFAGINAAAAITRIDGELHLGLAAGLAALWSIAADPQKRLSGIKDALRSRLRSRLNNNVCLHATANVT